MAQRGSGQGLGCALQSQLCFPLCPPLQSYCSDPSLVLDLKNLIVLFADTLQVRGALLVLPGLQQCFGAWAGLAKLFFGISGPKKGQISFWDDLRDSWVWSV